VTRRPGWSTPLGALADILTAIARENCSWRRAPPSAGDVGDEDRSGEDVGHRHQQRGELPQPELKFGLGRTAFQPGETPGTPSAAASSAGAEKAALSVTRARTAIAMHTSIYQGLPGQCSGSVRPGRQGLRSRADGHCSLR
jgi:hypothetical protein